MTPFMCAWRVLAMLRRVACVGACHNLSRTFLLCCRSGCACPSMRKHRDLCNSNNLDTSPSLYIYVHGGSSLTSIFPVSLRRSQIDGRLQTTCGEQTATGRTMCVRVLYPLFTAASCFFFVIAYVTCYCPLAPSFSIRAASHATRAPSRFLAVPNKLELEL